MHIFAVFSERFLVKFEALSYGCSRLSVEHIYYLFMFMKHLLMDASGLFMLYKYKTI